MANHPLRADREPVLRGFPVLSRAADNDAAPANMRRFGDSPSLTSGERPRDSSPASHPLPHHVDEYADNLARDEALRSGMPAAVFYVQAKRELKRFDSLLFTRSDRPVTGLGMLEDAENNIRDQWIEQGIWRDEWGPAWGPNSDERDRFRMRDPNKPLSCPDPRGPWQHERQWSIARRQRSDSYRSPRSGLGPADEDTSSFGDGPAHAPSRPNNIFSYQVSKETQRLQDRLKEESTPADGHADLVQVAFKNVRMQWQEDGLWQPPWELTPGPTWAHEDPALQDKIYPPAPVAAASTVSKPSVFGNQLPDRLEQGPKSALPPPKRRAVAPPEANIWAPSPATSEQIRDMAGTTQPFQFETIAVLIATLIKRGVKLDYNSMAAFDGKRGPVEFQRMFRIVKTRAEEINAKSFIQERRGISKGSTSINKALAKNGKKSGKTHAQQDATDAMEDEDEEAAFTPTPVIPRHAANVDIDV